MTRLTLTAVISLLLAGVSLADPPDKPQRFTYRGRTVSTKWVAEKYVRHAWQYTVRDSKLRDIAVPAALAERDRTIASETTIPPCTKLEVRVLQALGGGAVLATYRGRTIHIKGLDDKRIVDRDVIAVVGMDAGDYSYETAAGAKATVHSYDAVKQPTPEEFAQAILDGLVLYDYNVKPVRQPPGNVAPLDPGTDDWKSGVVEAADAYGNRSFYRVTRGEVK
jgi:hypothetical protein